MNRVSLLLGMGLAGLLTIALIVSADRSFAGIAGLRAVTAFAPAVTSAAATGPTAVSAASAAPATPAPTALSELAPSQSTAGPTARPSAAPLASPAPSAGPTPALSPVPVPSPTPAPSLAPVLSPTAPASPTPVPGVALTTDRGASAIVAVSDLVPGDSLDRTISVQNTGTFGFRYTVSATQSASTPLWSDATQGLQLSVATSGGTVLYRGPLSGLGSLAGPTILGPGASETLRYTFVFPAAAPDAFQGLVQDLTLVFSATQYP